SGKTYFSHKSQHGECNEIGYELRIVILNTQSNREAFDLIEAEALEYAKSVGAKFLNFLEVYETDLSFINLPTDAIFEIYSMTFYDSPDEDEVMSNYYLTGGNFSFIDEVQEKRKGSQEGHRVRSEGHK
ncbi:MAG: hypothetical protein AAF357_07380, partial [Verrucomicrobiota bacterium]